ncbi:MAG: exodeoxyribonuclease V subunit gamma, partial [Lachnospiraceae bacterium]|nr:exodeoxyribonuclease V subunit gamma [Lachnospiraceae bacterium]
NNVITQLMEVCSEVIVTLILPPKELESYRRVMDEHRLFSLSMKTMRSLEQLAQNAGCGRGKDLLLPEQPVYRYLGNPVLAFLEQSLFRGGELVYTGETGEALQCFTAKDPKAELREIFRRIRHLTRCEGMAYRDIAVVSGDLERYVPYAEQLAAEYDIPVFLDNNRKLEQNPFVEFMRSGLETAAKGYPYESMMHFLKSGMAAIDPERIDALENYLIAAGIRGEKAWKNGFTRRPAYLKEDEEGFAKINATRAEVMKLLQPLTEVKKGGSALRITEALYRFITQNHVYERLEEYVAQFHEEHDAVREKEYSQIYRYVCELLEQIAQLLKEENLTLEEYLEILEAGIAEIKVGVLPLDVDRVVIGDMERTRLKPIRVLFFAGVNDGVVPKVSSSGGMISDLDREFLSASGFTLAPTPRQQMFIQRLYLYHVMSRPSERLVVSYAKTDQKGESIRPSYLIGVLQQMFPKMQTGLAEENKEKRSKTAEMLSAFASGGLPEEEKKVFFTLFDELRSEEALTAQRLVAAAYYRYHPKKLADTEMEGLYGKMLKNSVSRMEQFASCAYAHYLKYGLHLAERETAALKRMDIGNLYHAVLEMYGRLLKEQGYQWQTVPKEAGAGLLARAMELAAGEYGAELLEQDARTAYRWKQMQQVLQRSVESIRYQLAQGDFRTEAFESDFKRILPVGDGGETMLLTGKIDRLDVMAKEDKLYLKVTDYKSGSRKLAMEKIYAGLQLQLLLYLREAAEKMRLRYPQREVVPAALFYYILKDPIVKLTDASADEKQILGELHKELRVTGLISSAPEVVAGLDHSGADTSDVIRVGKKKDGSYKSGSEVLAPGELRLLMDYVEKKVSGLGREILSGEKAAAPFNEESCEFCAHREICGFDVKLPGCRYRGTKLDAQTAWEKIRADMGQTDGAAGQKQPEADDGEGSGKKGNG